MGWLAEIKAAEDYFAFLCTCFERQSNCSKTKPWKCLGPALPLPPGLPMILAARMASNRNPTIDLCIKVTIYLPFPLRRPPYGKGSF